VFFKVNEHKSCKIRIKYVQIAWGHYCVRSPSTPIMFWSMSIHWTSLHKQGGKHGQEYPPSGAQLQWTAIGFVWFGVQIAPETCRAYNVKNNKQYEVHPIGLESNIYVTKMYGTTNINASWKLLTRIQNIMLNRCLYNSISLVTIQHQPNAVPILQN
jgi:hypothetical protein